jgi:hypothetical protein
VDLLTCWRRYHRLLGVHQALKQIHSAMAFLYHHIHVMYTGDYLVAIDQIVRVSKRTREENHIASFDPKVGSIRPLKILFMFSARYSRERARENTNLIVQWAVQIYSLPSDINLHKQ